MIGCMGPLLPPVDGRLTPEMRSRKLQALDFIKRYFATWGGSPSLGEIGGGLGITKQHAADLVQQLVDDGLVTRVPGKRRGITLIDSKEELSEADVILRLVRLGWQVGVGDRIIAPPLTETGLIDLPELDHIPDEDIGAGIDDGDDD